MGKNYSDNLHSIKNTGKDLTMKQMFDISEKLMTKQSDEIHGMSTINWEHSSWKHLSLVGDEKVISLLHTKGLRILRFCIMSWKGEREPTIKHCMGRKISSWGSKDNKKECESNAQLVSLYAKRFGAGQCSFLGPGSEKKWYSISEDSPQGEWD